MTRNSPHSRVDVPRHRHNVVVIGVDPGTLVTGYGIIARTKGTLRLLQCGTIRNDPELPLPERLHRIYASLRLLIGKHHPDEMAIESAFYGKNAQSAMKLGHARGVSLLAAVERHLPTAEYSPREIKKAIVGRGGASKEQVQFMVKSILRIQGTRMALDTSDALAIAICHLHRIVSPVPRHADWSSYVKAHPERVRQ